MEIRVAGYQMPVGSVIEENVQNISHAIDRAADSGAELLLTPEGSLSGYTHKFDIEEVRRGLAFVREHAYNRHLGLALGTCNIEDDGRCYNQIRFYRPDGEYLGFHSKILRCGSVDGRQEGEINHFSATDLRIFHWREDLAVGGLICNDMWANPGCTPMPDSHLSQQLSAMGARIILHAVNGGRNGSSWSEVAWNYHEANLRMRARAGKVWVVTVDNANPVELPCSAPSGVIDPSGEFINRTDPKGEQLFFQTISL